MIKMQTNTKECPACHSKKLWDQSTEIKVSPERDQIVVTMSCLDCNTTIKEYHNIEYDHTEVS
jgi:hypothetical protein